MPAAPHADYHDVVDARDAEAGAAVRSWLLGLPVDRVGMAAAVARLASWIEAARQAGDGAAVPTRQVVTLNAEMVMAARTDSALRAAIQRADLVVPDSMGVVWALRLLGSGAVARRVAGVDLLEAFAHVAARWGYRIFLLGGAPGVAESLGHTLRARYPGLVVAGTHAGSPQPDEAAAILQRIRSSGAEAVFVAFGVPAQEQWIATHRAELGAAVAMGVGGAYDFLTGRVPRAPVWMRRAGLEWLYRLGRQPWRWRRMTALPRFALAALWDSVRRRILGGRAHGGGS
jgi:N-acetylglucosaminyldiphosphoundecaprenol N-acetyl-beta-D-mannosaminyltransferase